jgi:hypothetical protein
VHFTNVTENYKLVSSTLATPTQTFVGQIDCETNPAGTNGALDCVEKGDMLMFLNLGIKDPTSALNVGADSVSALQGVYDYTSTSTLLNSYTLKDSAKTGLTQGKCFTGVTAGGVSYGYVQGGYPGASSTSNMMLCPISGAYYPTTQSLTSNPVYPNIYTVKKIGRNPKDFSLIGNRDPASDAFKESMRHTAVLDMALNGVFTSWPSYKIQQDASNPYSSTATIYKFHPPTGYNYVGECSNRGVCDSTSGICSCFPGYTGDNCGTVNALAM